MISYITSDEESHHRSDRECDCPTACSYYVYDPVLSYATTSEFAAEKLMESINATSLKMKVEKAREVTNRMKETTFENFRSKIEKVVSYLKKISTIVTKTLMRKIDTQSDYLTRIYDDTLDVWSQHNYFLQYQIYNIRKNFMRGRDAMEERTLAHLCNSFHEFVHTIETNMKNMVNANYTDPVLRESFYINTMVHIDGRLETASRALANFTQLYNAYRTGSPIFRYKFNEIPRINNDYAVPKELMNESTVHN